MNNAIKITAKVPTVYQLNSINRFGMNVKKLGNGSFYADESFVSKEEAIAYLEKRAEMYADTEQELDELLSEIKQYEQLTLDACTAEIVEVE